MLLDRFDYEGGCFAQPDNDSTGFMECRGIAAERGNQLLCININSSVKETREDIETFAGTESLQLTNLRIGESEGRLSVPRLLDA
jgi:hypothetical protein